jgi:hypothetical protein
MERMNSVYGNQAESCDNPYKTSRVKNESLWALMDSYKTTLDGNRTTLEE